MKNFHERMDILHPLSKEAIVKVLGLGKEEIPLVPEDMARELTVTFYPEETNTINKNLRDFGDKLKATLISIGVHVIPYEEALMPVSYKYIILRYLKSAFHSIRILVGELLSLQDHKHRITLGILSHIKIKKKVKSGVRVITIGERPTGYLPMDNVMSFTNNPIVTILDMPAGINNDTDFHKHFDTAAKLFAYHMTNLVICVGENNWILYSMNASHPIYPLEKDFEKSILYSLIPKLSAPIRPPMISEFIVKQRTLDINDNDHGPFVEDLVKSGSLLEKTGLYPPGKIIEELEFRNEFYKWVGKIHLDHRNGMSFGFLARQLPVKLKHAIDISEVRNKYNEKDLGRRDYFINGEGVISVIIETPHGKFCVEIPDVWVLTERSGANKTKIDPHADIIKIGLVKGRMVLQTPIGLSIKKHYKPSFDTKVILAHAVGNAMVGSILKRINPSSKFVYALEKNGMAISHWHGYLNSKHIPLGWYVYGEERPPVSCSSPQSAIYALQGKLDAMYKSLLANEEYLGDIHIEPQHGTNINYLSLSELGEFLNSSEEVSALGNKYLNYRSAA
ncbi:hypothetical protein A2Z53_01680 [Candidatus Giovannonibacteria bacterium RIFCSPHIGHO2_02_42_15]|uniref:Uncharacterized protein n=2 Tax=Candidatus Giovannoniibacteriota TaxID=1752738 RepID=A0A1F5VQH2_9BACT|nr:MAG: hypothetical protein UV11_C0019G0008 [Candidatus Giovannonibacteria bacterium GW2011_GWF2_42_19]OGF65311.1 MAG: hypothetical protein A2Z53_01680 [Candidatus Giovannonibacteria bacterium RIFCSPHIGHO2_02_42_15]